jgi:hypothetical protein
MRPSKERVGAGRSLPLREEGTSLSLSFSFEPSRKQVTPLPKSPPSNTSPRARLYTRPW